MIYCVCYDLNSPGRDYTTLINAIKEYGTWWHHLDSTWLIKVDNSSAILIRDHLRNFIDTNDELLVFPVGANWAGIGFSQNAYQWLHTNWNG
jgi:CRISPR associated protein Cas2